VLIHNALYLVLSLTIFLKDWLGILVFNTTLTNMVAVCFIGWRNRKTQNIETRQSYGQTYFCLWTISLRGYHFPVVRASALQWLTIYKNVLLYNVYALLKLIVSKTMFFIGDLSRVYVLLKLLVSKTMFFIDDLSRFFAIFWFSCWQRLSHYLDFQSFDIECTW